MKKYAYAIPLLFVTTLAFARHHHHHNHTDGVAAFGNNCEVLLCMSGKLEGDAQATCQSANQRYFSVQVYTPFFNPEATARLRETLLEACPGSATSQADIEAITNRFGRLMND